MSDTGQLLYVAWGDVPTWIGGLGTAAAFWVTYLLLRLTRREQRAIREEQRREQARGVAAWCLSVEVGDSGGPAAATVVFSNRSDEPVYHVRLAVGVDWASEEHVEVKGIPYVIPPRDEAQYGARFESRGDRWHGRRAESLPVEILFADAAGRFWRRDRYGGLTEIVEGLPPSSALFFTEPAVTI